MSDLGRPASFTPDLGDVVCERLADGESMRSISRDDSMPCMTTLFKWLRTIPEFTQQYEKAKLECHNAWFEDIVEISDNEVGNPVLVDDNPIVIDGRPVMFVDSASVGHARLRIDSRKWALSKLMPKKYGDRVQQDVNINDYTKLDADDLARKIQEKQQAYAQSQED